LVELASLAASGLGDGSVSRGCMIVYPCGCSLLNGHLYKRCDRHKAEGGELAAVPAQDAWLKRQQEKQT
jgi:hypothetical protein